MTLLNSNNTDSTFAFYRIGWNFAKTGLPMPMLSGWIGRSITKMYAEYDLMRGYEAYQHRLEFRKPKHAQD